MTTPSADLVAQIVQRVAELPDRTSPDDWPDAMLVTSDELSRIVADALTTAEQARIALAEQVAEYDQLFDLQWKRTREADKLWQAAHDKPDVWPDLGELIRWLLERAEAAEQENAQLREEIEVLAPTSEETVLNSEDEATVQRVRALLKDTVDKYDLAKQLDTLRARVQGLIAQAEQLRSIQHGSADPTYFEATPLIRRDDVQKLLADLLKEEA